MYHIRITPFNILLFNTSIILHQVITKSIIYHYFINIDNNKIFK